MDKETLLKRLSDVEWDDFEVKAASVELPKNVWDTVSAFSNSSGGWVILGATQHGKIFEITGVGDPEKVEQDFVTTLRSRNKFNVVIKPECKKYDIDGKTVLGFYISSAEIKPVYFNTLHNTFIRTASGDQRATEYEINALYREQSFGVMSAKPVEGTSTASFSDASYKSFRNYLKRMIPELPYNTLDDDTFNRKLQLVKDGKLTYGGLLFLGDNMEIQDRFPDFRVDYLEIPGLSYADAEPRYTFRIQEQENLWEYYFVLVQRLRIYADNPLYIGDMGIGHEDNKQLDALREALINLLMHSDFFSPMKPRIRVFTNRIEFENPGTLPRPIAELMKEDVSVPRNPVLAKLFRTAKLCENAGYGFDKMLIWKKETHKEVFFETFIDKTKVTFMLKNEKVDLSGGTIEDVDGRNEGSEDVIEKAENEQKTNRKQTENEQKTNGKQPENNQKTTRKQPEKRTEKRTENEQKNEQKTNRKSGVESQILEIIKTNSAISRFEIVEQIGNISEGKVIYYIGKLKQNNIIKREGPDKGGKWIIIKKE